MADELDNQDTPVEVPVENSQDDTPPTAADDPVEPPNEGEPVDEPTEPGDEPPDAPDGSDAEPAEPQAPIVFDPDAEDFQAKVTETLEKYELDKDAPDLHALITALQQRPSPPQDVVAEYADYGTKEELTEMLDRQTYLTTQREENGVIRPNTDKFVETLSETSQDFLYYDLAKTPSLKYKGLSKVEEALAESLAIPGDTVGTVLKRVKDTIEMVRNNAVVPPSDIPSFIPPHLVLAFKSLEKDSRNEISYLDPTDDAGTIARKLQELSSIQKGIDADLKEQRESIEATQKQEQAFLADVNNVQNTFIKEFRDTFTENLIKTVQFSDDPKRQNFEARKQVTLLRNAFLEDEDGEFARAALADAGITFDYAEARKLVQSIETAAIDLVKAKNETDSSGRPLNPVALNKAKSHFAAVGREWQRLAKNILDQQTKVTTEGKTEDIKKEVAKIKVAPKARGAVKTSAPSPLKKGNEMPANIAMFSDEYYSWLADQELARMAQQARAYQ